MPLPSIRLKVRRAARLRTWKILPITADWLRLARWVTVQGDQQSPGRDLLGIRYLEIEADLRALAESRVVDGDPAEVEERLLRHHLR